MSDNARAEYMASYEKFSSQLRTWLVAYGVGAPALVASNAQIWASLDEGAIKPVVILFLVGLSLQAVYCAVYKWAQWRLYVAEYTTEEERAALESIPDEEEKNKKEQYFRDGDYQPKIATKISKAYSLDVIADLGSIATYALGTYFLLLGLAA